MKNQRLLFFALFLGCFLPVLSYAQGVRYDIPPILTAAGKPVSLPVISLCPGTATVSGAACSPATAQSTTDITNGSLCPIGSPVTLTGLNTCQATGDTLGNAGFWLKPGAYIYCITGSGVTGACYNLTVPVGSTSSGTASISAAAVTGNLVVGGGSPWYDVTSTACGAKGDGVTDDTAAINTCLGLAKAANGGTVFFPPKVYAIAGQLNIDASTNVVWEGFTGQPWTPNAYGTPVPLLKFTGSTSPLISARSVQGMKMEGLNLQQTNAAFTGLFITVEHVNANDSQGLSFRYMSIAGTPTSANSTALLALDKADDVEISHVNFNYAVNAIRGMAAGGSYSFTVNINNSNFSTATGTISGGMIINPGGGWIVGSNNDFEMGTALGNPNVVDGTTTCSVGFVFRDNFVGDTTAGWTGTVLKNLCASSGGITVQGNEITGASTGNFLTFGSATTGAIITGNFISTFSTCLTFTGSNQVQITVLGNDWNACTTFQSGAPRGQGLIQDNTNKYIFYGAVSIDNAVGSFAPAATNQVANGSSSLAWSNTWSVIDSLPESAAPSTPGAGNDACYGDSTAHALECSYNNAAFSKVPLVGIANTWTAAQTIGSGGSIAASALLISPTAPTIAAGGCGGSAASIPNNNGTAAFTVNVGTTPGSACTITMPSATTGWVCNSVDVTTNSTSVFLQKQSPAASQTTTQIVITNFNDVAVATAFTGSDVLRVSCFAY